MPYGVCEGEKADIIVIVLQSCERCEGASRLAARAVGCSLSVVDASRCDMMYEFRFLVTFVGRVMCVSR